eukprot:XP_006368675.2 wall-associated receptor kinase-like 22 [Populus trichocarpa]
MVWKLVFQLMLMFQVAAAAAPIARSGCPDRCGDISIPYPFGIRKDCYMNEWFAIECNASVNPARAFISRINMEVLNISAERATATVKSPIISSNCTGREDGVPLNLTGTPFVFSRYDNVFIAVGCNTQALMTGITPNLIGCVSTCSDVKSKNFCEALLPSSLQVFNPRIEATDDNQDREGCKLAFLVNHTWFESNVSDPFSLQSRDYVPAELGWAMNVNADDPVYCRGYYNESFRSECECDGGYEGSPDLGCIDVDECKESKHSCRGLLKCVNTRGYFNCEINKLYIALIVIGAVVLALSSLMGIWWLYKLVKKWQKIELKKKFFKRNGGLLLQQELLAAEGWVQKTKIYSSKGLEVATDRFNVNRILGQGGQGTVYKGMLADGRIVAVKKSMVVDEGKLEEFINEVVVLSQINHRNVVKLLGCCLETEVPLLVYEFISNGNLYKYIHDRNEDFLLSWEMRLRIAIEVAGALSYLHSATSIPIYHRDIKSTNILLDEKYRAKVSDFGSSRSISIDQTHLTTLVQGTFGYLDPEYFQSSQFTEKSDVCSFGVVLVELISGQKPIFSVSQTETRSLATHFIMLMEDNRLSDVLDARVKEGCQNEEVISVANLAKRCLNLNGKNRPTMREVTSELERIIGLSQQELNIQENCKISKNTMDDASNDWDAVSTSITGDFDTGRTPSSDGEPLINITTC